jgi:hypothetical protein
MALHPLRSSKIVEGKMIICCSIDSLNHLMAENCAKSTTEKAESGTIAVILLGVDEKGGEAYTVLEG